MYKDKMVAVVKCNGQILREDRDVLKLPFQSEYSLLLKNLESRRAKVLISIDGQDVLDGNSLVLNPNSESELEGFMRGNEGKNKFKFIQKTKEISDYRGDRLDDGIIRVEYWFEKEIPEKRQIITEHIHHNYYRGYPWTPYYYPFVDASKYGVYGSSGPQGYGGVTGCASGSMTSSLNSSGESVSCYNVNTEQLTNNMNFSTPLQDEGITVKGTEINQQFNYTWLKELEEQSKVIILRLRGIQGNKFIEKPITVKSKIKCQICGKIAKPYSKYCSKCGTFLE